MCSFFLCKCSLCSSVYEAIYRLYKLCSFTPFNSLQSSKPPPSPPRPADRFFLSKAWMTCGHSQGNQRKPHEEREMLVLFADPLKTASQSRGRQRQKAGREESQSFIKSYAFFNHCLHHSSKSCCIHTRKCICSTDEAITLSFGL